MNDPSRPPPPLLSRGPPSHVLVLVRAAALALDAGLGRLFETVARVDDADERGALLRAIDDLMGLIDPLPVLAIERLQPGLAREVPPPPA